MGKILAGLLFILVDFNITGGTSSIDILPDFVGYILIIYGLRTLIDKSIHFKKAHSFSIGMAIYMGIMFLSDVAGITYQLGFLAYLLSLITLIISLFITYKIVMGVREIETFRGFDLRGVSLKTCWNVMAVFQIGSYLLFFIPLINIIMLIGGFLTAIAFVVYFNTTRNAYARFE